MVPVGVVVDRGLAARFLACGWWGRWADVFVVGVVAVGGFVLGSITVVGLIAGIGFVVGLVVGVLAVVGVLVVVDELVELVDLFVHGDLEVADGVEDQ